MNVRVYIAVIADQVGSRRSPDAVPGALEALTATATVLPFERTAGDEIQGLLPDGGAALDAITRLWRIGAWSIGLGVGEVEEPLPESTRQARGPAYVAARRAIEEAPNYAARLRVVALDETPQIRDAARDCETVLHVTEPLLQGRTAASWEALDLRSAGLSQYQIGARLDITQGAVSRRLTRAYAPEVDRASALAARLLEIARGAEL